MKNRKMLLALFLVFSLTPLVHAQQPSRTLPPPQPAQEPAQAESGQQPGVEVQARGPVHEAFAEPVNRDPQASPVIPKQPPSPVEEIPPDQAPAGDNIQWIPGYWAWDVDSENFIWVSGIYRDVPPGRHWVPGYWNQTQGGHQWVAGYWADANAPDTQLLEAPPEPIEEAIPAAPDQTSFWVPGCWVFVDNRYQWRVGFWSEHREGWVWTPECYVWTPAGYVFTGGYWDFDLRNRGLLFAPVRFAGDYWARPGWAFRPLAVVTENFLLNALFVREAERSYYFGDYFDPSYRRRGFIAWTDFRIGRGEVDPLFGYYRSHYHDRPDWATNLERRYALMRDNPAERPARTWTERTGTRAGREAPTGGIVPVTRLGPAYTLKHLNEKQLQEFRGGNTRYRTFSTARQGLEAEHARTSSVRSTTQPREQANAAHEAEPRVPARTTDPRPSTRQPENRPPVREPEPRTTQPRQPENRPPVREPEPRTNPTRQPEPRTNPTREPMPPTTQPRQPEVRTSPPGRETQPHVNPAPHVNPPPTRPAAPPRTIQLQSPNVGRPPVTTREAPVRTPPARPVAPNAHPVAPRPEERKK